MLRVAALRALSSLADRTLLDVAEHYELARALTMRVVVVAPTSSADFIVAADDVASIVRAHRTLRVAALRAARRLVAHVVLLRARATTDDAALLALVDATRVTTTRRPALALLLAACSSMSVLFRFFCFCFFTFYFSFLVVLFTRVYFTID